MDIIGTMYALTGEFFTDEEGNSSPMSAPIDGYHVNMSEPIEAWADKQVTPNSPSRVYGGHETFFYVFADEAEFKQAAIDAGLMEDEPTDEVTE